MTSQPHVDEEALRSLDRSKFYAVQEGSLGDGVLISDRGRIWGRIAVKEIGHDDEEAFASELVGLDLVVDGL